MMSLTFSEMDFSDMAIGYIFETGAVLGTATFLGNNELRNFLQCAFAELAQRSCHFTRDRLNPRGTPIV